MWVKINERLPSEEGIYTVLTVHSESESKRFFNGNAFENYDGYRVLLWKDESITEIFEELKLENEKLKSLLEHEVKSSYWDYFKAENNLISKIS